MLNTKNIQGQKEDIFQTLMMIYMYIAKEIGRVRVNTKNNGRKMLFNDLQKIGATVFSVVLSFIPLRYPLSFQLRSFSHPFRYHKTTTYHFLFFSQHFFLFFLFSHNIFYFLYFFITFFFFLYILHIHLIRHTFLYKNINARS